MERLSSRLNKDKSSAAVAAAASDSAAAAAAYRTTRLETVDTVFSTFRCHVFTIVPTTQTGPTTAHFVAL